ncbi:multifunctional 2',3'-cyclic-nucleotide 2'-phosphodiesterase/5'-nucleotidase/3'-nucleotidase, partial [Anaerobacillus alkaliphilus]
MLFQRHKRHVSMFLVFILLFSQFFVFPVGKASATDNDNYILKVLHTNDIHSKIDGLGKAAAYINSVRSNSLYSLYLDAGDIFSGNPVVDLQHGKPIVEILNKMNVDAMTIGNHEFDYGQTAFAANEELSNFPWLSANMEVVNSSIPIKQPEPFIKKSMGEFTVGILTLTQTPPATAPAGVVGIEFHPYNATVNKYKHLKEEVDVFIALTHIGYSDDRKLAQDFPGLFDVIIGAHSHTALSAPNKDTGTPIAQTGGNLTSVGNLTIEIDRITKDVVSVNGHLQPVAALTETDTEIQSLIDQYNAESEELLGVKIGFSNTGLSRSGNADVPLGNFWTDAMRDFTGADVALTNGGGLRADIKAGDITKRDIYTVEPFANEIMVIEMTGAALKDVIHYSYTRSNRNRIDLQTSGLHYTIKTNAAGGYLDADLFIEGQPINPTGTYKVAVGDYIGTGGSGYNFVGEVTAGLVGFMTDSMIQFAEKLTAEGKAIDYRTEGRIKVVVDTNAPMPGTVIGSTTNGLFSQNKDKADTGLGNLYTDAIRVKGNAQIGILNASSVNGEIPAGNITDKQIESLDQFGNEIVVVKAKGEEIEKVILSQSNHHKRVDLQVSGLKYKLVESGEATPKYSGIEMTLADGTAFDKNAVYTVAYNNYMHGTSFYGLGSDVVSENGKVWQSVVDYVKAQTSAIDYVEGQRITVETKTGPVPPPPVSSYLTVAQAIANNTGTGKTVRGYVVGHVVSTNSYNFEPEFKDDFNLLLADNPNERDVSKLLPVQIATAFRGEYGLKTNPKLIGELIEVTGSLEAYFTRPGLRTPTAFAKIAKPEPTTHELVIMGTTDIHAHIMPYDYMADAVDQKFGLAKVYTLVQQLRAKHNNTLLVDN